MPEYPFHPYADLFPLMSDAELQELADDIDKHGLEEDVILFDGQILDGRNRALACDLLIERYSNNEYTPEYSDLTMVLTQTGQALEYVVSKNLRRRHLTPSQLAMIGVEIKKAEKKRAKERRKATLKKGKEKPVPENFPEREDQGEARDVAAKRLGISGRLIDRAETVIKKGTPELADAVRRGEVSVSKAAAQVTGPKKPKAEPVEEPDDDPTPASLDDLYTEVVDMAIDAIDEEHESKEDVVCILRKVTNFIAQRQ